MLWELKTITTLGIVTYILFGIYLLAYDFRDMLSTMGMDRRMNFWGNAIVHGAQTFTGILAVYGLWKNKRYFTIPFLCSAFPSITLLSVVVHFFKKKLDPDEIGSIAVLIIWTIVIWAFVFLCYFQIRDRIRKERQRAREENDAVSMTEAD